MEGDKYISVLDQCGGQSTTDITTRLSRLDHNLQINSFIHSWSVREPLCTYHMVQLGRSMLSLQSMVRWSGVFVNLLESVLDSTLADSSVCVPVVLWPKKRRRKSASICVCIQNIRKLMLCLVLGDAYKLTHACGLGGFF